MKSSISQLEGLRVSDLNAMIRSIIYDPSRVVAQLSRSSPTTQEAWLQESHRLQESSVKLLR
jgi:hypothetical protein